MQQFYYFSESYWSNHLSKPLEVWYDNVEHEPENGIFYEFEWEALDENNRDRRDDMPSSEQKEVERRIRDYLRDQPSLTDYD